MSVVYGYVCRVCGRAFKVNTERFGAITCPRCTKKAAE